MRQVEHDGNGTFVVRFAFDRRLVDLIKTLPNRRWNANDRCWTVPDTDVVFLVDLLRNENFVFDAATREMYTRMGGVGQLDDTPVAAAAGPSGNGPALPLFDSLGAATTTAAGPEAAAPGAATDFTVSRLNEQVRYAIAKAFPEEIWLVGEVSGFNKSAHRRIVGFHLVEMEDGRKKSEVSATLFDETRQAIAMKLARAGHPFKIEDEVTVRMKVRVDLYVPWGAYRVVVEDLDVDYTLGEAARRREQIVRRLTEAGLVDKNSALPLPVFPLKLGLITSLKSDAYNDVLRTLQESGFAFDITVHGARVQGHSTEPSVLNALDWFRERQDAFDAVLICRGGGSRTDLAWFDSEPLGKAVATFPLPVVVGIGHEQDTSVLDHVGRRAKTPTAAAGMLVERVAAGLERVEDLGAEVLALAAGMLEATNRLRLEQAGRLTRAAHWLLEREQARLAQQRQRAVYTTRAALGDSRQSLARIGAAIPAAATLLIERRRGVMVASARRLEQSARTGLVTAGERLRRGALALAPAARRAVDRERERLDGRARRLAALDPQGVLERGFAVLRSADGRVLTRAADAPAGADLTADLNEGTLRLTSRGAAPRKESE